MRIAVDARPLNHLRTGIGQYTFNLLKRLILCRDLSFSLYVEHIDGIPELGGDCTFRELPSLPLPSTVLSQAIMPIWARRDQVDLFWSPRHHLPSFLPCPSVATIHDLVWKVLPATMRTLAPVVERLLMPRAIRNAARIIAVSNSTKSDIEHYFPDAQSKITVIYEASDLSTSADRQEGPPFFLFVGTKEPRKNIPRLLQAWKLSGLDKHGFSLMLAGQEGWKVSREDKRLRTYLGQSVVDVEPSRDSLATLYQNCVACVLPSLYEGFGLPIVEAMSFGKPIITSDISSMPEIAGKAALLIDPYSPASISDAMRRIAFDATLREKLAKAARVRSALFSWEKSAIQTFEVFQNVVRDSKKLTS